MQFKEKNIAIRQGKKINEMQFKEKHIAIRQTQTVLE